MYRFVESVESMSARRLLRTGLVLGTRAAPGLSAAAPLAMCGLAVVCYLVFRGR
jgi:hypothetical protein